MRASSRSPIAPIFAIVSARGSFRPIARRLYKTPTYYAQELYANRAGVWPLVVQTRGEFDRFDVSATRSERGDRITLFITNTGLQARTCRFDLSAWEVPAQTTRVWTVEDTQHAGNREIGNSFWEPARSERSPGRRNSAGRNSVTACPNFR